MEVVELFKRGLVGLCGLCWLAMLYLSLTPTAYHWASSPPDEYYPEAGFLLMGLPIATSALILSVCSATLRKNRPAPIMSATALICCVACGALILLSRFLPPVADAFVVEDEQGLVAEATLELCGFEDNLNRVDDRLTIHKTIECEGSGYIKLRYASGAKYDCMVGYVTPGAAQRFEFKATESGC